MSKRARREQPKTRRDARAEKRMGHEVARGYAPREDEPASREPRDRGPVVAKTDAQRAYMAAMTSATIVFAYGPAGTGKTFLPTALAADALDNRKVEKLILSRPALEAGEKLGFLPGEMDEKYEPYLRPFKSTLNRRLGRSHVENLIRNGKIEPLPIGFMRGETFRDALVLIDEAQNLTVEQMKMVLTRIGEGSKLIITGDPEQSDLPRGAPSGLADAIVRIRGVEGVAMVRFGIEDVVRHDIVQRILRTYEKPASGFAREEEDDEAAPDNSGLLGFLRAPERLSINS